MITISGQWNRVGNDEGEFQVTATDFRVHEDYGAVNGISHDICVVKVPDLAQAMPDSCNKVFVYIMKYIFIFLLQGSLILSKVLSF